MLIDTILFDLDGTLLPMDTDKFIYAYYGLIKEKFKDHNCHEVMKGLEIGIRAMLSNDGSKTNEKAFWNAFYEVVLPNAKIETMFEELYEHDFDFLVKFTHPNPLAKEIISILKEKNYRIICATNPLFPRIATQKRIKWAGLDINDFLDVTTFESSNYAKPSLGYYEEVLNKYNLSPSQCLMVGNDLLEDLVISKIGVKTYLVTDCLVNKDNSSFVPDYTGSFEELLRFVKSLEKVS